MKDYKKTPLWDVSLPLEKRLDYLMAELTLEEKLLCLGTGCPQIPRLGIPEFHVGGEGAHGVQARHDQSFDRGEPQPTTILPNPIGMSETWDEELIRQAGQVVGNEARGVYAKGRHGGLCLWAPTIDMERDPRWGRTEEAYGEDPYLAGKMASAYIRGMRGEDPFYLRCGATLKHFYANNAEEGRTYVSSSVDPRNKHEYYLEPFRRAVVEGGAEGIMTAYNEINGVPCILNHEVQDIAKDQWGLHHVVCDGGDMKQTVNCHGYYGSHAETVAEGLRAGIDCFTDDITDVSEGAREALRQGMIGVEEIDRALRNHFATMIRLGLLDAVPCNPYASIGEEALNTEENQKISYEMAKESVVLLQNQKRTISGAEEKPLLPLHPEDSIAVVGPLADVWYKDWYSGIPPYHVTPLEGIRRHVPKERIRYESGLPQIMLQLADGWLGLLEDGKTLGVVGEAKAEVFEVCLWDHTQATLRSRTTGALFVTEDGRDENDQLREGIVTATSQEAFGWFIKEAFRISYEGDSFREALEQGKSLTIRAWNDVAFYIDERKRLRVPVDENAPTEDASAVGYTVHQEETKELAFRPVLVRSGWEEAARVAADCDRVLIVAGPNPMINCKEEVDRKDIEFPIYQRELVDAVHRANADTVLVLVSSLPFAIGHEKETIPAILCMASGSMELGNALADILYGESAPAGRLSMTWYQETAQLPDINDYDIIQHPRTYQYFEEEVLYPFGHGLSYTDFAYKDLKVSLRDRVTLEISVDVTNQGKVTADEVIQIYAAKPESAVKRAKHCLKAFRRIKQLQPGETRTVTFEIPTEDLKYYDVVQRTMLLEPGTYEIQAAASSEDIRLRASIELAGTARGTRDAWNVTAADHYDRSENMILWEGHMGWDSACTRSLQHVMCLEYDAVSLEASADENVAGDAAGKNDSENKEGQNEYAWPEYLVLDADMAPKARVHVFWNDREIGSFSKEKPGREGALVIEEGWAAGVSMDSMDASRQDFLAADRMRHGEGFGEIRIPLDTQRWQQALHKSSKTGTLKLIASGDVRICRWWMSR